jgi:hypothetical protein
MKKRLYGYGCVLLMCAAILFAWQDRNGFCIGDELLRKIGIPAWSNGRQNSGIHYTALWSIFFMISGWIGAVRLLRTFHPRMGRWMVITFLAMLFVVDPSVSQWVKAKYYVWQPGEKAIEYFPMESECKVKNDVARCQLTFQNYGLFAFDGKKIYCVHLSSFLLRKFRQKEKGLLMFSSRCKSRRYRR